MTLKLKGVKGPLLCLCYYNLKLFETLKIKLMSSIRHNKPLFDSILFNCKSFRSATEL